MNGYLRLPDSNDHGHYTPAKTTITRIQSSSSGERGHSSFRERDAISSRVSRERPHSDGTHGTPDEPYQPHAHVQGLDHYTEGGLDPDVVGWVDTEPASPALVPGSPPVAAQPLPAKDLRNTPAPVEETPRSPPHKHDSTYGSDSEYSPKGHTDDPACSECLWEPEENRKWVHAYNTIKTEKPGRTKLDKQDRIVPADTGRTIVLLFDGTSDTFDSTPSNVVRLASFLRKDDTTKQLVYYQTGIGTTADPRIVTTMVAETFKVLDTMFAFTLDKHMKGTYGYEFLMDNYTAGDKICIFGFSRGAYTARALAGMLRRVGLLSKGNSEHLPFAYNVYKSDDNGAETMAGLFKDTFSIDVKIDFVGVWDTVASTGLVTKDLPFVGTNDGIRVFRHALALDERRGKFIPTFYRQSSESSDPATQAAITDAKEVWFAGAHCDVGGGSVRNSERHSLARIPLRWMIRECFLANTGMIFDAKKLRDVAGLDLDCNAAGTPTKVKDKPLPPVQSLEGRDYEIMKNPPTQTFTRAFFKFIFSLIAIPYSFFVHRRLESVEELPKVGESLGEAEEERRDAISPVYDQMELRWLWRLIDFFPFRTKKYGDQADQDTYQLVWNRGVGRKIHKPIMERGKVKIHRSVKTRLEAQARYHNANKTLYVPKVRPNLDGPGEPVALPMEAWNVEESSWFEWEN
ncbi:hypothetical protein OE88DRAFT_1675662 [Heliocybe sulcata]|uniref:T6SS Phospholipase effector Tle1-like catalytic domain-containing protein n=1 Tax=Heliocybe sulcata TaxID=5364 RepID=A0A5C3NBC5_9AGAM|nr:hypothetical protein OE88DRAFT_1675662 [Heliocybe sulcata]